MRDPHRASRPLLPLLAAVLALAACEDLGQFKGDWEGTVSTDPHHNVGFFPGARLQAHVAAVRRADLALELTLPGRGPLPFTPIQHAADDVLGDMRMDGEPLRTYLGFVTPVAEPSFLTVVSLFAEDRLEVRLIRGANDAYGVFYLTKTGSTAAGASALVGRRP